MQKPITILREEFAHELADLCNKSALPGFVKVDILKAMAVTMEAVAQQEYMTDLKAWKEGENHDA